MTGSSQERLQETLRQVQDLLLRQRVLEDLTHKQETPRRDLLETLVHRQNAAELHNRVRSLHPADLAFVLEGVPIEQRLLLWEPLPPAQAAQVLAEVSESVRDSLVGSTPRERLLAILRAMDPEDLAWMSGSFEPALVHEVVGALDATGASWLRTAQAYREGSVGRLMTQEIGVVREGRTVADVIADLRTQGRLPRQTDAVYVVDARSVFKGALTLETLLVSPPEKPSADALRQEPVVLSPNDDAGAAAKAFERYDLVAAPVVDERGKLLGRLTVDAVLDYVRERSEREALRRAGLAGEEDLFAPAWDSARNRWLWLSVNLVTAFVASRAIGLFEDTIAQTVALATLMPIVASVGGNTGNQTVALVIRGLALDQINAGQIGHLFKKELTVGLMNGIVWGAVMTVLALLLYQRLALGLVMGAAILLNLIVAAVVGVAVPLFLHASGRDPAQGASVLLTFTTDGMGFLIFLGLARLVM